MSEWDDWDSPIFEDEKARSSKRSLLLGVGAFVAIGGMILVGFELSRLKDNEIDDRFSSREAVRAAFEADEVGVGDPIRKELDQFFEQLMEASAASDADALRKLFDAERYFEAVEDSGVITSMTGFEKRSLKASLRDRSFEGGWAKHTIVHVDPLADPSECVVYVHITDEDENSMENFRCWVMKTERGWKLFDWEVIDFGMRESVEDALLFEYSLDRGSDEFIDCTRDIEAAYNLYDEGDEQGATDKLHEAALRDVHHTLRDNAQLRLAYAWSYVGDWRECLTAAQAISAPDDVPGAYSMQIQVYDHWGHYEKVAELAEKHELAAGLDPFVLGARYRALDQISRLEEAVPSLQKWLRWAPENVDALQYLGSALPLDQKHLLVEHLEAVADPVETAVSLANFFSYRDEPELIEQLGAFVEKRTPESPQVEFLRGISARAQGEFEEAALYFLKAYLAEQDEEQRDSYFWAYLGEMVDLNQFVEAYEALGRTDEAFEALMEWFDPEEDNGAYTRKLMSELLEARRKTDPDDPQLHYYSGVLLKLKGQYEAADKEFQAVAQSEDEDLTEMAKYERVAALVSAGRGLEAYDSIDSSTDTFRQVASNYQWREKPQELRRLVEAHKENAPDDPWLKYYEGVACLLEKDYQQAESIFDEIHRTSEEEYVRNSSFTLLLDTRLKSHGVVEAYRGLEPGSEDQKKAFDHYAEELFYDHKLDELQALITLHERLHPDDIDVFPWKVNRLWELKDYESIVRDFAGKLPDGQEAERPWRFDQLENRVFRSYLRLKRFDHAITAAQSSFLEDGDAERLLIAHLAAGRLDEARNDFRLYDQSAYSRSSIYADEDVGDPLLEEEYCSLREQFPPSISYSPLSDYAVLFLDEPLQFDSSRMREVLVPVVGESADILPLDAKAGVSMYLVNADGLAFVLTQGDSTYLGAEDLPTFAREIENPQLKAAFENHRAWLALEVVTGRRYRLKDQEKTLAGQVVSKFLDEHCLALFHDDQNRIVPNTPEVIEALRSETSENEWEELGEEFWLYRELPFDPEKSLTTSRCQARLYQFARAFASRTPDQEFLIQVRLSTHDLSELHWVNITQIEKRNHGAYRISGTFQSDSQIFPGVKADEPVSLAKHDVFDWKYGIGQESVEGRTLPAKSFDDLRR